MLSRSLAKSLNWGRKMRQILNFFITCFVLWASAWLFPGCVRFDGYGTLVLVTLLFYLIESIIALVCFGFVWMSLLANRNMTKGGLVATVIILILVVAISGFGTLLLIDWFIDGFWISNIGVAFLLAVAISIFSINPPKNQNYQN